jgi:hypothetical protein
MAALQRGWERGRSSALADEPTTGPLPAPIGESSTDEAGQ